MVRIRCSSDKARYKLGKKFGCDPEVEAVTLINLARDLGLNVVGISFHIGSSCEDFEGYAKAIEVSRQLYEVATSMGFQFRLLDIGGGYPGENFQRIDEFSAVINRALDENFPIEDFPKLEIISEPGRYMVESAFILVAMVHSRKVIKNANGDIEAVMLYLNEGVYSNFLAIPLGPEFFEPIILPGKVSETKFKTTIWGKDTTFDELKFLLTLTASYRSNVRLNGRPLSRHRAWVAADRRRYLLHKNGRLHNYHQHPLQWFRIDRDFVFQKQWRG